jgi:F-type H+-transporting ATPase subunit gamma
MPSYREYNVRLASMGGMRRVTSTMKMVAASHLYRAQAELRRSEAYGSKLARLLQDVRQPEQRGHRLLAEPAGPRNALLLVIASNRGLCGAFNANVARAAKRWIEAEKGRFKILRAAFVGRKGHGMLRRDIEMRGEEPLPMAAHPIIADSLRISRGISRDFLSGRYDEVYLVHNRFVSSLVSRTEVTRVLPVGIPPLPAGAHPAAPRLREPDSDLLLEQILLLGFDFSVFEAMLHSVTCEHAARVVAMDNATTNLHRLEAEFTLLRNRARQASITKELAEIVGGAEALT